MKSIKIKFNLILIFLSVILYFFKDYKFPVNNLTENLFIPNSEIFLVQIFLILFFIFLIINFYQLKFFNFNEFIVLLIIYFLHFLIFNLLSGTITEFSYWDDWSKYVDLINSINSNFLIPFDLYEYPSFLHLVGLISTFVNKIFFNTFEITFINYVIITRTFLALIFNLSFFFFYGIVKKIYENKIVSYLSLFVYIFNYEIIYHSRFIGADSLILTGILFLIFFLIYAKNTRLISFFILGIITSMKYTPVIFLPILFLYFNSDEIKKIINSKQNSLSFLTYFKQIIYFGFLIISLGVLINYNKFIDVFKRASAEYKNFHSFLGAKSPYGYDNKLDLLIDAVRYILDNIITSFSYIFIIILFLIGIFFFNNRNSLSFLTYFKQIIYFIFGFLIISPGVLINYNKFIDDFKRASAEYKNFHPFLGAKSPYGYDNKLDLLIDAVRYILDNTITSFSYIFIIILFLIGIFFFNNHTKLIIFISGIISISILSLLLGNTLIVRNLTPILGLFLILFFKSVDQIYSKHKFFKLLILLIFIPTGYQTLNLVNETLEYNNNSNYISACEYIKNQNITSLPSSITVLNYFKENKINECKDINFYEVENLNNEKYFLLHFYDIYIYENENNNLKIWPANKSYFTAFNRSIFNFNYYPTFLHRDSLVLLSNQQILETGISEQLFLNSDS